jgi:hypothetical protein
MDLSKFIDAIEKSGLPFVYGGSKLNDEKCQKVIKQVNGEGTVLGAIVGVVEEGLVITEKGIWFSSKKRFPFDSFILHSVSVTKRKGSVMPCFDLEFVMFDLQKAKSFIFKFTLVEPDLQIEESVLQEFNELLNTLVSETGTEYTEITDETYLQVTEQDPNTFDFVWERIFPKGDIHTIITLKEDSVTVTKLKIDDKTKIQTPEGTPVTISRSAIASVKKGRGFSPLSILGAFLVGIGFGFLIFGGIFAVIFFTIIGFLGAFPKLLIIGRKDRTKYKTRFYGSDINDRNYERFINVFYGSSEGRITEASIIERIIPPEVIEGNKTLKKIAPHAHLIGLGFLAVIALIVMLAVQGPSTAKLEKQVLAAMAKEYTVTDIRLIKISKGNYTGTVTGTTVLGRTVNLKVNVITDGRNIQWEITN